MHLPYIVRCALFAEDIGVEYGDVILFDGAPLGEHPNGTPIFPHLATLKRSGYRTYLFGGTQPTLGVIAGLSAQLPDDTVLYVLTEQFAFVCPICAKGRTKPGERHEHKPMVEHKKVKGKLCVAPGVSPTEILSALDRAVAATPGTRVLSPSLAQEAGDTERAQAETRELQQMFE